MGVNRQLSTVEALERMTDRGEFERLAMSILRFAENDCSAAIHTGINAQGATIRSPVDGFCLVPGIKPDRFLFLQFTTIERSKLRTKWLNDDKGDLIKAYNLAHEIREKNPEADFIVILATNQRLDIKLVSDTLEKAKELKFNCRIWDQSRLAYFLDNKPDGHWLRREYLGVEAELLSESLLSYICKESLARYEKENQLSDPKVWLSRTIDDFIRAGILDNRCTFQVLVGDSGFGKSVAAYTALKNHIEAGGYGLWVPADLIQNCTSIENVVDKTLRDLYPDLSKGSEKYVRQFIRGGSKFILVVDDINRIDEPKKIIDRLLNWSRPQPDSSNDIRDSYSAYFIICPLWTQVWDLNQRTNSWIHSVSVGSMTPEEGLIAIKLATSAAGISLTSAEDRTLATKLGNDPVLIGLFYQLISNGPNLISLNDLNEIADRVVERFIDQCIKEVASDRGYLSNEYLKALSCVCTHMLIERRFNPSWEEIQYWLEKDHETLNVMRELIRHKKLIRLTDRENRLVFRHDRIRETFLVNIMISMLEDPLLNSAILQEPYYAEIIGKAIILSPQIETIIQDFAENHPLVLFEALKNFGNPTTDYHRKIINIINIWVEKNLVTGVVLDSVVNSICWSLISTGSDLRDQMIEHAKKRHKGQLLDELRGLLTSLSSTDKERKGSLDLVGFLEFVELEKEIIDCWNLANDKEYVLADAIWAGSRCCTDRADKLLGPMMNYLASLSDKDKSNFEPSAP